MFFICIAAIVLAFILIDRWVNDAGQPDDLAERTR